jgi:hypothetical protein
MAPNYGRLNWIAAGYYGQYSEPDFIPGIQPGPLANFGLEFELNN